MVLYPEVQKAAREQIDRVVGSERLPTYEDRDALTYISALMREVLRWRPMIPVGMSLEHIDVNPNTDDRLCSGTTQTYG